VRNVRRLRFSFHKPPTVQVERLDREPAWLETFGFRQGRAKRFKGL
jgi:hypothetical protein